MKRRTGNKGRPADARNVPELAGLAAEVDEADAAVVAAVRAHVAEPTQRRTLELLSAQLRLASLRAALARACDDDAAAARESDLVVRFAKSRDDAAKLLWGDELAGLHAQITTTGGVAGTIAAELADELATDEEEARP